MLGFYDETCLFEQFSLSTVEVGFLTLAVTLGKGPLLAQPSLDEKDFSKIVDEDTAIHLHVSRLVTLKSLWH
jgi:hypothetical protein